MNEEKFYLKNRQGQMICGLLDLPEGAKRPMRPILLLHGFKGYMNMPFISGLTERLTAKGAGVFRFDFTNGLGESEGNIYDCTVSHYLDDLMEILDYVVYRCETSGGDLAVFGTSLGGLIATLAAEKDARIKFLITHSPAYDWSILRKHPDITSWQEGEWIQFISKSKGMKFKVDFNLLTDGLRYDPYPELKSLAIPKLFIHSGADEAVPLELSQRAFNEAAPPKELLILPKTGHNPTDPATLDFMAAEIDRFLSSEHF